MRWAHYCAERAQRSLLIGKALIYIVGRCGYIIQGEKIGQVSQTEKDLCFFFTYIYLMM